MTVTLAQEIAGYYAHRRAMAFGDFQLVGGGRSNVYIDGRLVTTHAPALKAIARSMTSMIEERKLLDSHDTLVAPVVSGVPIAVAIALLVERDFVLDRGSAKAHGSGRRFEGHFNDGDRCLIVDDLITGGTTVLGSVTALADLGKRVTDVLVVVDREEGAAETLRDQGIMLHSILGKNDLVKVLT